MDTDKIENAGAADNRGRLPTGAGAPPPGDTEQWRAELNAITAKIIGCIHKVSRILGPGFLEKVYENSLALELSRVGMLVGQQHRIEVHYEGVTVGDFIADLLVDQRVFVEIKAVKTLDDFHTAQCLNYLRATGLHVCLLVNFGTSRASIKRIVQNF